MIELTADNISGFTVNSLKKYMEVNQGDLISNL